MDYKIEPNDYLLISFEEQKTTDLEDYGSKRLLPFADGSKYESRIIKATKLTEGEDVKEVYDTTIDLKNVDHEFKPGDTIGLLPYNNEEEVLQIIECLNLSQWATKSYKLGIRKDTSKKKAVIPSHLPICGTLKDLFRRYVDIRSSAKKVFLKSLLRFTTDPEEIEELQRLCAPNSSNIYNNFINSHRSLISIFKQFRSCNPPIERLLEHLPPLQPRPYSISSSPLSKELHITFSIVEIDKLMKGVCTGWLKTVIPPTTYNSINEGMQNLEINENRNISFYFRKSNNFQLPNNCMQPIIMIGPGTGVAPFIGFLQHRYLLKKENNQNFGFTWLFYGCRYHDRDFLYRAQLDEYKNCGILTKISSCYSREGKTKTYVQNLIQKECNEIINKIIHENAVIYVCGDAKNMAKDVKNTIISCLMEIEGNTADHAEKYIKLMEKNNRYIQDIWI